MAIGESGSVRLRYVDVEGTTHDVDATVGETLMSVAVRNFIRGIGGDCGGNCACGTCHILVSKDLAAKLPPSQSEERDLLAFIGHCPSEGHRLGCQIPITTDLEGAMIRVAKPV